MSDSPPYLGGLGVQPSASSPGRVDGPASDDEYDAESLYRRFEQYAQIDANRNNFIHELLVRCDLLSQQCKALNAERSRNREFVQSWQIERQSYVEYLNKTHAAMAENPFVMILIDGNDITFSDSLVCQGETGGRIAAAHLHAAVQKYIETEDIPAGARIVCHIYADIQGLDVALFSQGVIQQSGDFVAFTRGFTCGQTQFDFIDAGKNSSHAQEKIIASFKLYSYDFHCRRLLFGCTSSPRYAQLLEVFTHRADIVDRVVLLKEVPYSNPKTVKSYKINALLNLFRETKIDTDSSISFIPSSKNVPNSNTAGTTTYNILSGLPSRFPAPTQPASTMGSPLPSRAALEMSNHGHRTSSGSTQGSDSTASTSKPPHSWAAKAAAPPPHMTGSPAYKPANRDEIVARNRAGQRVDPQCKNYDKAEVDRIKRMKLCNTHFLRGDCPYTSCAHSHTYKPTKEELSTLRLVARMAPCSEGSSCSDPSCLYGHRCPAPPRANAAKGTKSCIFGELCKFPPELHDVDMNVVKTLVLRG